LKPPQAVGGVLHAIADSADAVAATQPMAAPAAQVHTAGIAA
jgi:hypothetical protein